MTAQSNPTEFLGRKIPTVQILDVGAMATGQERYHALVASGLTRTIVRPWYVLGPGHRWPYALLPIYAVLEKLPSTRDSARRLGLITRRQMVAALVDAVENRPARERLIEVPESRRPRDMGE